MVGHGVEYRIDHPFGKQAVHHLLSSVVVDLSHHIILSANAINNVIEVFDLVVVADLCAKQIIQSLNDFRESLFLRIMGLTRADRTARLQRILPDLVGQPQLLLSPLGEAIVGQRQL